MSQQDATYTWTLVASTPPFVKLFGKSEDSHFALTRHPLSMHTSTRAHARAHTYSRHAGALPRTRARDYTHAPAHARVYTHTHTHTRTQPTTQPCTPPSKTLGAQGFKSSRPEQEDGMWDMHTLIDASSVKSRVTMVSASGCLLARDCSSVA